MTSALLVLLLAASGDRLAIVNKTDSTLTVWDIDAGKSLATIPTGKGPHEVSVSKDGAWAYVSDYQGTGKENRSHSITVIDLKKLAVNATIELLPNKQPHGSALTADGKTLWVTTEASTSILKVDTAGKKIAATVPVGGEAHMVVLAEQRGRGYAACLDKGDIVVLDLAAAKVVTRVATGAGAEGIDVTPDGKFVLVTNGEVNTVSVVDAETNTVLKSVPVGTKPLRVKVAPDGKRALVTNMRSNDLYELDASTWEVIRTLKVGKEPIGIQYAADGKTAWIANTASDVISVVDLATWEVKGTITAGKEPDGMALIRPAKR